MYAPRMRNLRGWLGVLTITIATGLTPTSASAEECPAPADAPAVASIDAQQRLDYLRRALDDELQATDTWSWTLGTLFGGIAVAQAGAIAAFPNDRDTRIDLSVGSVGLAVDALSLYVLPLQLTVPLRSMQHHWNDPNRCEVIARAERTLVSVQKDQAFATGITPHIVNILANAGIAIGLTAGFGHYKTGPITGLIGAGIGEGNAFTQPSNLKGVLAHYRAGELDGATPPTTVGWGVAPVVGPQMTGASFALTW
jgi:hypothetical protein